MAVTMLQPPGVLDPFLQKADYYLGITKDDLYQMTSQRLMKKQKPGLESNYLSRAPDIPVIAVPPNHNITVTITTTYVQTPENSKPNPRQRQRSGDMPPRINQDVLLTAEDISIFTNKLRETIVREIDINKAMEKGESITKVLVKLNMLSKVLTQLNGIVNKILLFYASRSLGFPLSKDTRSLDELIKVQESISHMRRKVQWTDLKERFQTYSIETTKEHILASILGLHEDFGNWLHNMDPECRVHQVEMHHINTYIEDREIMLEDDEKISFSEITDRQNLTQALTLLGFIQKKAEFIAQNVEEELICLQPPSFWALRFLEHTMLHHPLIGNLPLYPFPQQGKWNQWFTLEDVMRTGWENPGENGVVKINEQGLPREKTSIRMINIDRANRDTCSQLVEDLLNSEAEDDSHELLYHGTSHMNAHRILIEGFEVNSGRNNQDFSIGKGVYLSYRYSDALKWARSEGGEGGAVMVFKVPKQRFTEEKGLDFTDENTALTVQERQRQWERIVQYGRRGQYRRLRQELKKAAFVKGPHCANPLEVAHSEQRPSGFNESFNQICICDEDLAEQVSQLSNVCCMIFL